MNSNLQKVLIVSFFALFFMTAGWVIPALYASHAPADMYIQSHSYDANNVSIDAETHTSCFDRTIKTETVGTTYTELYLVSADDIENRIEIQSDADDRFFEGGRAVVRVKTEMPKTVEPGRYYYERVYDMELANGRVSRTFTFKSNEFYVTNGTSEPPC